MTIRDLLRRELGRNYEITDIGDQSVILFHPTDGRTVEVWRLPVRSSLIGVEWLRDFIQRHKRPFDIKKAWADLRYARRAIENKHDELVRLAEKEVRKL